MATTAVNSTWTAGQTHDSSVVKRMVRISVVPRLVGLERHVRCIAAIAKYERLITHMIEIEWVFYNEH